MKKFPPYLFALVSLFLMTCQEFERLTLLKTELDITTDTLIVVKGILLDLKDGDEVSSYGHCWSESGEPTLSDSTTQFEVIDNTLEGNHLTFLSNVTNFIGSRTYYFKSYIKLQSGTIQYGNTLTITSEQTRGRWVKLADNWYATKFSEVGDDGTGCGPANQHVVYSYTFMNAGFYQDKIFTCGGIEHQYTGIDYIDPKCEDPMDGGQSLATYYYSVNDKVRLFDDQWRSTTNIQFDSQNAIYTDGYGGVGIVDNGFFYYGGGQKSIAAYAYPFYDLYQAPSYNVPNQQLSLSNGFKVLDIQNSIILDLEPNPKPALYPACFLLNNKIYVVTKGQVMAYNIASNHWQEMNPFPGNTKIHGVAFVINGKAYVGSGFTSTEEVDEYRGVSFFYRIPTSPTNEFWEYTTETDSWKRIADFPGTARGGAFSFALQGYGYMGCGTPDLFTKFLKDFWRYDPIADQWKQLDDFPGGRRFGSVGFANQNVGSAGFGMVIREDEPEVMDRFQFYEYDNKIFYTLNHFRTSPQSDLWIYNPSIN